VGEVGFIVAKTQNSVTLLMAEGKQATIPNDDIDDSRQTNQSSMPENLSNSLSPGWLVSAVTTSYV
jgi:hypothetical protein